MYRLGWFLTLCWLACASPANAQGCGPSNPNCTVPTAPAGTSNNQAASTAFVSNTTTPIFRPESYLPQGTSPSSVSDWEPYFDAAMSAINTAGSGILSLTNGRNYVFCSLSPNGLSPIRYFSNTTIQMNGATLSWCNNFVKGGPSNGYASFTATVTANSQLMIANAITGTIQLTNNIITAQNSGTGLPFSTSVIGGSGNLFTIATSATASGTFNVVQSTPIWDFIYSTNSFTYLVIEGPGTLDLNGTNNSCSSECGGINAAIGGGPDGTTCTFVQIIGVTVKNNPGSNNIKFGSGDSAANCQDVYYYANYSTNSGDHVNLADYDHSTYWVNANNWIIAYNMADNGASLYGTFLEEHGVGGQAFGNVGSGYHACFIISNEAGVTTEAVSSNGNTCSTVDVGAVLASFAGGNLISPQMNSNNFSLNAVTAGTCLDAVSNVTGGNVTNVQYNSNNCDTPGQTPSGSLSAAGISFGVATSFQANGNHINNTEGPCILSASSVIVSAVIDIEDNVLNNCGLSTSVGNQVAINLVSASAIPASVTVRNNPIYSNTAVRTLAFGILDALTPQAGQVIAGPIVGATTPVSITANNTVSCQQFSAAWGCSAMRLGPFTISTLPACNSTNDGNLVYVTNGVTPTTFNATVTTTGSTHQPVFCNSVVWTYH